MLSSKRLCLRIALGFVVMTTTWFLLISKAANDRQHREYDYLMDLNNSCLGRTSQLRGTFLPDRERSTTTLSYSLSGQRIKPNNNTMVIYNRVPKCGSSGLIDIIRKMALLHNFTFLRSSLYMQFWLNEIQEERLVNRIEQEEMPLVFERHVHFVDFAKHSKALSPIYINVVREPIQRLASWYYYRRYQIGHVRKMPLADRIRSYDECVLGNHSECTSPKGDSAEEGYFKVIPFFCGQEEFCSYPNDRALHRAVSNVKRKYLAVGTTEYLHQFLQLLETKLPGFFSGAPALYEKMEPTLKERYHTRYKLPVSSEVTHIMKTKLKLEYQFYYFIRNRFRKQYEQTYNKSLPL